MPKITNVSVTGLERSIYRSGYSFMTVPPGKEIFDQNIFEIEDAIKKYESAVSYGDENPSEILRENPHIKRAIRLSNVKSAGEDQFLTGIKVDFDLTIALKAWTQLQRYKFMDFVSSFSLMHRATKMDIGNGCNKYVYGNSIDTVNKLLERHNDAKEGGDAELEKQARLELLYNIPVGFELTAGMSTNYRCLKNMYSQRRRHFLPDWQYICDWIETLPLAGYLITGKEVSDEKTGNGSGLQ